MLSSNEGYCSLTVKLAKNSFNIGENAKIEVNIDNSECSHSIKKIKVILRRVYLGFKSEEASIEFNNLSLRNKDFSTI